MRCNRRLLNNLSKDHVTNENVHKKIQAAFGENDELLTLVKKRNGLAKRVLQSTVKEKRRGRQKMAGWMTFNFTSFSTVFQSYPDNESLMMKGLV